METSLATKLNLLPKWFVNWKVLKANKEYRCSKCKSPILPGEEYAKNNMLKVCKTCLKEWSELKIYGEPGRLVRDGKGLVQCHICGIFYDFLGRHIGKAHNLTAFDYKQIFGLNRGTPLASLDYSEFHSRKAKRLIEEGKMKNGTYGAGILKIYGEKGRETAWNDVRLEFRILKSKKIADGKNPTCRPEVKIKISESQKRRYQKARVKEERDNGNHKV